MATTLFIGFSDAQGQLTPKSVMESCHNSKLIQASMVGLVTCKNEEDPSKSKGHQSGHNISPIISLWGFFLTLKASLPLSLLKDLAEFQTHPRFYGCPFNLQE